MKTEAILAPDSAEPHVWLGEINRSSLMFCPFYHESNFCFVAVLVILEFGVTVVHKNVSVLSKQITECSLSGTNVRKPPHPLSTFRWA